MLLIDHVVGSRIDPALHDRLHHLQHHGRVDVVSLPAADMARRRLRIATPAGEDLAIALPRDQKLFDGAVLLIDDARAIVVRAEVERWLRLQPRSIGDAVELGYHAGNLHWRVRFEGEALLVALDGPVESYMARLGELGVGRRVQSSVVAEGLAA
jgi:urease accessory protein